MKKIIALLLAVTTILSLSAILITSTSAYMRGDLNGDGKINAVDANMMLGVIMGDDTTTKLAKAMGDVNSDTKINAIDMNALAAYFVGSSSFDDEERKVNRIIIEGVDISEYSIVCPEDADESMKYSAEALSDHLGDASGFYPPIVTEACEHALTLKKDATIVNGEEGVLGKQGYRITSEKNGVVFEGGLYSGCMHAVYDFLYNYVGYRFYYKANGVRTASLDNAIRFVYESDTISISNLNETHLPSIPQRIVERRAGFSSPAMHTNLLSRFGQKAIAKARYGLYGFNETTCHGLQRYGFMTEAEMNQQDAGNAYGAQPCFSDKSNIALIQKRVLDYLDQKVAAGDVPGVDICGVDVSQIDASKFCMCRLCRNTYLQDQSNAGAVVKFGNSILSAIQERPEYKDKINVNVFAYWGTEKPPLVTRPDPMISISFCFYPLVNSSGNPCNNHAINDPNCPSNAVYKDYLEKWFEYTDNVCVWYYPLNGKYFCGTSVYTFNLYEDIKYLSSLGVYNIYVCGSDDSYDWGELNIYLMQRLMWNVDITYDEFIDMIKEALGLMYGDGYEYIFEILSIMEEASDRSEDCYFCYVSAPPTELNMTWLKSQSERLLELKKLAIANTDEEHMQAVSKLLLHINFLYCAANHTDMWLNGNDTQRAKYKEVLDEFTDNSKELEVPICCNFFTYKDIFVDPSNKPSYDLNPFQWMMDYQVAQNPELNEGTFKWVGWKFDFNY